MATFWEKGARSVSRMFSLLCLFVALVVCHLVSRAGPSASGASCSKYR